MKMEKRIKRIKNKVPDNQGESWEELLDRLGLEKFKAGIGKAKSFLDLMTDQSQPKVWKR